MERRRETFIQALKIQFCCWFLLIFCLFFNESRKCLSFRLSIRSNHTPKSNLKKKDKKDLFCCYFKELAILPCSFLRFYSPLRYYASYFKNEQFLKGRKLLRENQMVETRSWRYTNDLQTLSSKIVLFRLNLNSRIRYYRQHLDDLIQKSWNESSSFLCHLVPRPLKTIANRKHLNLYDL